MFNQYLDADTDKDDSSDEGCRKPEPLTYIHTNDISYCRKYE